MNVRVHALRLFATHHATAADALAGTAREPVAPAYALLVGRARRFTSLVTQLHIEVTGPLHALCDAPPVAVFATCHGEIRTAESLMSDLRTSAVVSSARFAQSVHNTASGAYAVATNNSEPTMTLTGSNAAAAGWLEAAMLAQEGRVVLLSIADEPVPATFQGPAGEEGVAAAFLLGPVGVSLLRAELDRVITVSLDSVVSTVATRSTSPSPSMSTTTTTSTLTSTLAAVCRAIETGAGAISLGSIAPSTELELRVQETAS